MISDEASALECKSCAPPKPNFFARYRDFSLSRDSISDLFECAFISSWFFPGAGWPIPVKPYAFLLSALIGGTPLFIFAARGLIINHDITAGVMASVAMIAAIIVGEYSAAALVVFMMSVGEWLENFTVARADNALRDLAKLIPPEVTVISKRTRTPRTH